MKIQWRISIALFSCAFVISPALAQAPAEHFIYERLSDTQFRMTYETSRDGIAWQMADSLVFTRHAIASHR